MRVYFEKPRTSTGWKGFINDPYMDDSFHIEEGMEKAREFLLKVTELGLPPAPRRSTRSRRSTSAT
jgi:3-deoxy-7-phosphoheptulonate synthase